jgi:hypothetical protein
MPQWQYSAIDLNENPGIDVMNDAGGEGWELVTITNNIAYLKRQIEEPADAPPSAD